MIELDLYKVNQDPPPTSPQVQTAEELLFVLIMSLSMSRTLQTVGPSHARTYTVAVYFKGERIGCGKGPR